MEVVKAVVETGAAPVTRSQGASGDNVPYQGASFIAVSATFLSLAVAFTTARMLSRIFISHNFGLEDGLIIPAIFFSACLVALGCAMLNFGMGKHIEDVPPNDLSPGFLGLVVASAAVFAVAICCTKLSILTFYHKTFFAVKWFRRSVWILAFVTTGYSIASILVDIFSCVPVAATWDITVSGRCIDRTVFYIVYGALNTFTDFAIVLLPTPLVWKLTRLSVRERLAVFALLGGGALAGGVGAARFWTLAVLAESPDVTWNTNNSLLFVVVELNVGIICASISVMRPFFRRFYPSLLKSSSHSTSMGQLEPFDSPTCSPNEARLP